MTFNSKTLQLGSPSNSMPSRLKSKVGTLPIQEVDSLRMYESHASTQVYSTFFSYAKTEGIEL